MADADAERAAINAAMQRLLDGTPKRSTGGLSILQLAAEAGIKRWVLTHKHTDLADEFRSQVEALGPIPAAYSNLEQQAREAQCCPSLGVKVQKLTWGHSQRVVDKAIGEVGVERNVKAGRRGQSRVWPVSTLVSG
jgi:hypothetical protein